ncbi:nicotinate-nucleotide--dimethylbenzimidazole phosphoribosyltransferase [Thalassobacillus sp. C254]|uniref:nicotinate-nucleotide--dimethylbenzimidazole phosphoribosyltransferase n=1 Tax=Thalassobacillus sp. C254 TaxID=1225341 RepID=UPI0006D2A6E8|nr:nicotinate-nucleotide--dimethylbenzimidazole phosphoribosyltransferase [Thalassobacillus sp. C254]
MTKLNETIRLIEGIDTKAEKQMEQHINSLTKPLGSLGSVEPLAIKLAGIGRSTQPEVDPAAVVIMAADHGVTKEGVSAFPSEVTKQMVHNFMNEGAAINALAQVANASVEVVDIGVKEHLEIPGLINKKVRLGTNNMVEGPALTREEAITALEEGIEVAEKAIQKGAKLLALGEMGIGNTTASSAILSVLSHASIDKVVGSGTGINEEGIERKIQVIMRAIKVNQPNPDDPIEVLAKVGGLEIAGLAGVVLGAAAARIPVLLDGFITAVAALTAVRIAPLCEHYLMASHQSMEPGHAVVNQLLGLQPLIDLHLRLGEGSGAALSLPIVRSAVHIVHKMATFEEAKVSGIS